MEEYWADIIEGCKSKQPAAQAELYRRMYKLGMQTAMRYSADQDEASNILTLACMKIFTNISSFNPQKGSLKGWVSKIVVHTAIDFIRTNKKFSCYTEIDNEEFELRDNCLVDDISAAEILEMVRWLPPATQTVFNLYVIEGYSHKEIALLTGIAEGTSKWHLNSARKKLQEAILNNNRT